MMKIRSLRISSLLDNWVLIIFLLIAYQSLSAQKNELKLGLGYSSFTEVGVGLVNGIGTAVGASIGIGVADIISITVRGEPTNIRVEKITSITRSYGNYLIAYNQIISQRINLKAQLNYNPFITGYRIEYSENSSFIRKGRTQYHVISAMGGIDFKYMTNPKFELYSSVMGGILYDLTQNLDTGFALHLSLIGLRFGAGKAFWSEIGLGVGPLLSVGYSQRF